MIMYFILDEYAASYTDDLLFFSNDPKSQLAQITGKSDKFGGFKIKGGEGPTYHLGIDYEKVTINGESFFKMTSETFAGEAMRKLETIKLALDPKRYSRKSVQYHKAPIPEGYMPENDTSEKLGLVEHRMFQRVIGLATWAVVTCRPDLAQATNHLNRFQAAPRKGHLEEAIKMMDYFGTHGSEGLLTDLSPHRMRPSVKSLADDAQRWSYQYDHLKMDEISEDWPKPLGKELEIVGYYDANWIKPTPQKLRSVSGWIVYAGNFPLLWWSR